MKVGTFPARRSGTLVLAMVDEAMTLWLMSAYATGVATTLEDLLQRPAWQADAACRGVDTEVFFPRKGGGGREARAICAVCPVREQCLELALEDSTTAGIFGGTGERERRRIRAGRKLPAAS